MARPTPPPSKLLRHYGVLESASEEMLEAARAGDWDSVCRLEAACAVVIARLRELSETTALAASEQGERMRILRTIVANDAEIRRISDPMPEMLEIAPHMQMPASRALH